MITISTSKARSANKHVVASWPKLLPAIFLFSLIGCGGGGSSGSTTNETPSIGEDPASPTTTPPPSEIVATWQTGNGFESDCVIRFNFKDDFTFSTEAADERRSGFYTIDAENTAGNRRLLEFTFSSDNAMPNCDGSTSDETGLTFSQWAEFYDQSTSMFMDWYNGSEATAALVRVWRLIEG